MKKIIVKSCTECPYSDFSIPDEDKIGNFICYKIKREQYDYKSKYDDKEGKFIISLKGISNPEYSKMLDSYIPNWCPLEELC